MAPGSWLGAIILASAHTAHPSSRLAVTPSPWHACTPLPCQSPEEEAKQAVRSVVPSRAHIPNRTSQQRLGETARNFSKQLLSYLLRLPRCKEKKKTCSTHDINSLFFKQQWHRSSRNRLLPVPRKFTVGVECVWCTLHTTHTRTHVKSLCPFSFTGRTQ